MNILYPLQLLLKDSSLYNIVYYNHPISTFHLHINYHFIHTLPSTGV
jgi:hypothetical protein